MQSDREHTQILCDLFDEVDELRAFVRDDPDGASLLNELPPPGTPKKQFAFALITLLSEHGSMQRTIDRLREDFAAQTDRKQALIERLTTLSGNPTNIAATTPPTHTATTATPLAPQIRLPHSAAKLFGRDDDLAWLDRAWNDPAAHVASSVAWGGVGKTSLVAEWRNKLLAAERPTGRPRMHAHRSTRLGSVETTDPTAVINSEP